MTVRAGEPVLDPGQRIIDAHHHLYDRLGQRYLADDYLSDIASGHDVRATVFVQARGMYRTTGPLATRPVGETEFAREVGDEATRRGAESVALCAAIVGCADLLDGGVRAVLEAHVDAGGGRFRGIRHVAAWDADAALLNPAYPTTEDMLAREEFRAGFAHLGALGLSFDAWLHFHQIPRLTELARAFPETRIVLDHCGGIIGIGAYEGHRDAVFATWSRHMIELARCPNVMVKVGGLGMRLSGFGFDARAIPPSSAELAEAWRPWVERCIEAFGAARCMFESNFPPDKASTPYATLWNAMKRLASPSSDDERDDLFWRSAARFYRFREPG